MPPRATSQVDRHAIEIAGDESVPWTTLAMALGIDLLAVAVIWIGGGGLLPYLTAGALHGVAAGTLAVSDRLEGSRRTLALSLLLALPPVGAILAAVALGTRRRSHLTDLAPDEDQDPPVLDAEHVRRVAMALPACEALLASGGEDRQALLAALTQRGDADAVSLLRWLTSVSPDLAVETALALEELSVGFESDLEEHRLTVTDERSHDAALRAGTFICRNIESGIVDPVMVDALATEARRYFALARELDAGSGHGTRPRGASRTGASLTGASGHAVTMGLARLEMAAMHPEAALLVLNQATLTDADENVPPELPGDLIALRTEARFASHAVLSHELVQQGTPLMIVGRSRNEVALDG